MVGRRLRTAHGGVGSRFALCAAAAPAGEHREACCALVVVHIQFGPLPRTVARFATQALQHASRSARSG